jgi:hypothetical protein
MEVVSSSGSATTVTPEAHADGLKQRKKVASPNGSDVAADEKHEVKREFGHSFPIHTHPSPSILSSENSEGLSLRGFGNVGRDYPQKAQSDNLVLVMIFGNLRLIVENYVKVAPPEGVISQIDRL